MKNVWSAGKLGAEYSEGGFPVWGALGFPLSHAMQRNPYPRRVACGELHRYCPLLEMRRGINLFRSQERPLAAINQALMSERPRTSLGRELKGFGVPRKRLPVEMARQQ